VCSQGKWNYKKVFDKYPQLRALIDFLVKELHGFSKSFPSNRNTIDSKVKEKKVVIKNENKSSGSLVINTKI
jgi:hypothetical protein